jgi:xanthine dehydrogenase YagR molybdenum-binding subunit
MLYRCDNVTLGYRLAKADTHSPGDMRAPGAPLGVFALESAMDELAEALAMDPVALRLRNYAETDAGTGKPHTSKALREAYAEGAARIGWSRRPQHPGAWREGRELIGLGMATGIWEANFRKSTARAVLGSDGLLEVSTATSDIGTGTTTILAQIAAETMGVAIDDVTVRIADSDLPESMLQGGSWTAASSGAAVEAVCRAVRDQVFHLARSAEGSPLANIDVARAVFANGMVSAQGEPDRCVAIADAMRAGGLPSLEAEETVSPSLLTQASHVSNTHSAVFAEVAVDAELGIVRLTRIVVAVAAGRILNEKTARSQIIGGVVFGIGMALHEQSETDHTLGRIMNRSLAEYHLPAHADMPEIDVIFVDEPDNLTSPLGVKGLGEIGIVGTAAAIANAIHNASGKRIRALPITIDRMLAA